MRGLLIVGLVCALLATLAAAAGCPNGLQRVSFQLKWFTQAQFAGYVAAQGKGFFARECLDVSLRPGGATINIAEEVMSQRSQIGIMWLSTALQDRELGFNLTVVSQVFRRASMVQLTWASDNVKTVRGLEDRKVGTWFGGLQFPLKATFQKVRLCCLLESWSLLCRLAQLIRALLVRSTT